MLNVKALTHVVLVAGAIVAGAVNAGQTNPLHPSYPTFAASLNFAPATGTNYVMRSPLQPNYFQWNVATPVNAVAPMIVVNNPLQPNYKRS